MKTWVAVVAAMLACAGSVAQDGEKLPHPRDVVQAEALVSQAQVQRGAKMQIAVVARIRDGFHVNSSKPREEYLIPTAVTLEAPAVVRVAGTEYPAGEMTTFRFSAKALDVYEGEVTMVVEVNVAEDAAPGTVRVPVALRYQACNDEVCLPPVTQRLEAEFTVVAGTPRGAKPRVFKAEMKKAKKRS